MESYVEHIKSLSRPAFQEIRKVAVREQMKLSKEIRDQLHGQLRRGVSLLESHEHLCQYLFSFGNMHQAKILDALNRIPGDFFKQPFEVIDWGCGQALGTLNLLDLLHQRNQNQNLKRVTLIEPSKAALERAELHLLPWQHEELEVITVNSFFERISSKDILARQGRSVLHIFSNILDVAEIDLKHLSSLVDESVEADNYLLCVGPLNPNNHRMEAFFRYFDDDLIQQLYLVQDPYFGKGRWTYKGLLYKLEYNEAGHLIPIEYYPTVQFHTAYELDAVRIAREEGQSVNSFDFAHFEVAAPFDLGASVYDDVHPVLAVLNNIISRGLPTRASVFLEEQFQNAFDRTEKKVLYGEFTFQTKQELDYASLRTAIQLNQNSQATYSPSEKQNLQFVLTPVLVARFQKVLLEAIITGHLSLDQESWQILVEEKDVPFGALALEDFRQLFENLTHLSQDYFELNLPEIQLQIVSNEHFKDSPLHIDQPVSVRVSKSIREKAYDLVVTQSIELAEDDSLEGFSRFRAKNNCYFNIGSARTQKTNRSIYTSSLISYKNIVDKDTQGNYSEIEETKANLTYFLQLLFRKEAFRPGQLPILDRALKNLPVIGLLPTGGGKSLTYQIAGLLQPGVTMVIDPLKSLMKDQYDGLIRQGIDCATYINSSLDRREKLSRERMLESSELLFIFLSPERLSIAEFRERLKNMHDYNVYFSYGVIDEVHCVSEWGHDFRFSYLHLGRNLYNYVRSKEGRISLFGLTATASFDVLADVERELSGNGAFPLDADVTIRHENTNRLELQYKIERVPIEFGEDKYYDKGGKMPPHLPKAVNISYHWPAFDSKKDFLKEYYPLVPQYISTLIQPQQIDAIKTQFSVRQSSEVGADTDLSIEVPGDYFREHDSYPHAGIVFCPHVNSTGISIRKNTEALQNAVPHVRSFSGRDNDEEAIKSLEDFRDNKSPLMVATKAFGMGIDKPNVRFTVNLNYSSSLESFVQEAGRAGRDRKMALSTILVSDYSLVKIDRTFPENRFPLGIIRNKWFKVEDLKAISDHFSLAVPEEYLLNANPSNDIVRLHCSKDNKMFAFHQCSETCTAYRACTLRKVNRETKGWKAEKELIEELGSQGIRLSRRYFQYLNPDYRTVMYFFGESFKGDLIEKRYMFDLLKRKELFVRHGQASLPVNGFLTSLLGKEPKEKVVVFVPYLESDDREKSNYADLSKAIYRMCCIELIEDFTQDYRNSRFRIIATRKESGQYFEGLLRFLRRYFTEERAREEIGKAQSISLKVEDLHEIEEEIYKCLAYLTTFVYDKISEKRKRAIDEMRNFCLEGLSGNGNWLKANEKLKDFIYYYFNSKYAKSGYKTDNGEPFSLVDDTEEGKKSDDSILFKYLRVIDDEIVGVGTPLDNVRHLYGAVRLIGRSLTDSNPAFALLEVFCLAYLGTKNNQNLENQLVLRYSEGMRESSERASSQLKFWELYEEFNEFLASYLPPERLDVLKEETLLLVHSGQLSRITQRYTQ